MKATATDDLRPLAPVELVLLRILRHGLTGTLLSGAAGLAMACDPSQGSLRAQQDPSAAGDAALQSDAGTRSAQDGGREGGHDAAASAPDTGAQRGETDAGPVTDAGAALDAGAESPTRLDAGGTLEAGSPRDAAIPADGTVGSGSRSDAGLADAAAPQGLRCPPSQQLPVFAAGLRPSQPHDYLAVRVVSEPGGFEEDAGAGWTRKQFTTISESGSRCATASSSACAEQVRGHPAMLVRSACSDLCTEVSVVTTHGDRVARATGAELTALLAPIDTADEALLLVAAAGYELRCDDPAYAHVREVEGGFEVLATRLTAVCAPFVVTKYQLHVSREGLLRVLSQAELLRDPQLCVGRVPAGLKRASDEHDQTLGSYLAHSAHLEEASVFAFERLARELTALGAPRSLIAEALHAADDEVRHARVVGALARLHGRAPVPAEVEALPLRSLEEVATENAVEGCVRETYGALVAAYQARAAGELRLRAVMREIASDEARHAALSHRVHAWGLARLDLAARERVLASQQQAIAELEREVALSRLDERAEQAGLPSPELARRLLSELRRTLWSPQGVNRAPVEQVQALAV